MKKIQTLIVTMACVYFLSCTPKVEKETYSFATQTLGLEQCFNGRELGGYLLPSGKRIRKGLLLRGGNLRNLTAKDSTILHDKYHLALICDFRSAGERDLNPDKEIEGARYAFIPIMSDTSVIIRVFPPEARLDNALWTKNHSSEKYFQDAARDMYPSVFEDPYSQQQYSKFFREMLSTKQGAVYFHCSHGKDRTGMGSLLLLAALGADRELMINDFAISNEFFQEKVDRLNAELKAEGKGETEFAVVQAFCGINTDFLCMALDRIDSLYGSMDAYLHNQIGLSDEDIAQLRERYLE